MSPRQLSSSFSPANSVSEGSTVRVSYRRPNIRLGSISPHESVRLNRAVSPHQSASPDQDVGTYRVAPNQSVCGDGISPNQNVAVDGVTPPDEDIGTNRSIPS